jgi:microcystin synthetase protein McyG
MNEFLSQLATMSPKRLALLAVELQQKVESLERSRVEPVAVVGVGCRFPGGAVDPESFWQLLREGRSGVREVPAERWNVEEFFDADPETPGKSYARHGGFLDRIDQFEPQFFGITPREAASMDPQQRLLLEVSWEALENAGIAPRGLTGSRTGVFVGITTGDYAGVLGQAGAFDVYAMTGNAPNFAAGRLSYILGLQGPSLSVDTACSSSLVTIHLACQSLRSGESRLAIAGGVNVMLSPHVSVLLSKGRMLAPDGRCKTFDASADGYVRGEGCGVVVMKRLSDAVADGDRVMAVIRASAVNQDGPSSGLTVPNGPAQQALVREALAQAGIEPAQVDYVEAHGTGTSLGDPIEVRALSDVFGQARPAGRPLLIGAVKTNIGHLEAAAGVASFIKVVLALQHKQLPPHLHLKQVNPAISLDRIPARIPTSLEPWTARGGESDRRIAGVSSFGASGTNAHVVLEEAPQTSASAADGPERPRHVLALSARSPEALANLAGKYAERVAGADEPLADLCFTANTGRSHFTERVAFVARTGSEMQTALADFAAGRDAVVATLRGAATGGRPKVAFLFTGQGSQYAGMARELYETQPTFRRALDSCAAALVGVMDTPLLDILYGAAADRIDRSTYAQPANFAVEYALAELWRSWGVTPGAVLGHSMGEYAAACVAGVFRVEDALKLIATRGRLMHSLPTGGAMAAVGVDEDRIRGMIAARGSKLSIAGVNGPTQVVITGPREEVAAVVAELAAEEVPTHWVPVTHAFHSPLLDPIVPEIERTAASLALTPAQITVASTLTGSIVRSDELTQPAYWGRQARETVQFSRALSALYAEGYRTFVELGPTPALLGAARRAIGSDGCSWIPSLKAGRSDWEQMLESVGALYANGAAIDWAGFDRDYVRRKAAPLPTYPFERQRYWLEARRSSATQTPAADGAAWKEWLHDLAWQPTEVAGVDGEPSDAAAVGAAAEDAFRRLASEHQLERYDRGRGPLDALCASYVVKALGDLGWQPRAGEQFTADALMARCGVSARQVRLFHRLLSILAEDGMLRSRPDGWEVVTALAAADPDAARQQFVDEHPAFVNEVALLARCGSRLADVLTGRTTGVDILFTSGDSEELERVYRDTAAASAFNALVADTAARAIEHVKTRPIRILEIGAGTGGTTSAILPRLDAARTQYVYTDVSAAFFARARRTFAEYPFIEYRPLDISKEPAAQGFDGASFDLIVAANVLHATPDLRKTLQHATGLLADGGAVVMLEGTAPQRFIDLTFGLTDDWWGFEDRDVRPSHVLVNGEQWQRLLAERGLTDSMAAPRGAGGRESELSVIFARRPAQQAAARAEGRWLIFGDTSGYGDRLASRLRSAGGDCTLVVKRGAAAQSGDSQPVAVDPTSPEEIQRVVAGAAADGGYRGVVHLWALDEQPALDADSATLDRAAERACGTTVYVAQALAAGGASARPSRLALVTRGAQDVVPSDTLSPLQAMLWGLGRVIALEHPELECVRVDLDPGSDRTDDDIDALVDRLVSAGSDEDQLARRRGRWFGARLVPSAIRPVRDEAMTFRADAAYLITGGLAGLGLLVAERMVEHGARNLVLIGRREPGAEARAAIDRLVRGGAEIRVERADVADRASLDRVLASIDPVRAPLRGIVHAAGALDDGALFNQSWDRFRSVLAAKLHGTWHLDAATRGCPLDFFVLFSTSAALLGSPGQANHAAANSFMDALARHRRRQGLPGVSINWGAWSRVGAAARRGVVERVAARGVGGIEPAAGLDAFEHALRTGCAQVAVIPIRWDDFLGQAGGPAPRFFDAYAAPVSVATSRPSSSPQPAAPVRTVARLLSADEVFAAAATERPGLVAEFCAGVVADVVGMQSVRATQRLSELGADSLMAVEIRNRIQRALGATMPLVALLDGTTVNELAGRLVADLEAQRGVIGAAPQADVPVSAAEASELLSQLDGLSEEEMDSLLNRFAARTER